MLQGPIEETTVAIGQQATQAVSQFAGNPAVLAGGIALIVAGILVLVFLKKIIVNSLLGAIGWAILEYAFGIKLPFLASVTISVIFGLPGLGVLLVLRFFGLL